VTASGTVDFPKDARIGDLGSSRVNLDPSKAIGPYDGIKAAAPTGVNVVMDDSGGTSVASSADFVVVVAGLTPEDEGEEYTITPEDSDRDASLALDGKHGGTTQNNYIKSILALGKPTVVVLEGGSVIDLSSFGATAPAIVMAWYPGQSGGAALGSLLFGKANFSGKLPVTWPNSIADEPQFSGSGNTTQMGYYIGYRWFDNQKKTPAYAFGHGLSYSALTYSNLQVPCTTVTPGGVVNVTVDVQNSGAMDADETVFAFDRAVARRRLQGAQRLHPRAHSGWHGGAGTDSDPRVRPELLGHHVEQLEDRERPRTGHGRTELGQTHVDGHVHGSVITRSTPSHSIWDSR
jgi:hypothetical protein